MNIALLSNPYEGNFVECARAISNSFVWNTIARDIYDNKLNLSSFPADFNDSTQLGMRPEVGPLRLAKRNGSLTTHGNEWYSAQLSVVAFLSGFTDSLDIRVNTNTPILIAGHSYVGEDIHLKGNSGVITVCKNGQLIDELVLTQHTTSSTFWKCSTATDYLINLGSLKAVPFVEPNWIKEWNYPGAIFYAREKDENGFIKKIEEGYAFLEQHFPEYYLWSIALVEEICSIPLHNSQSTRSLSFSFWPNQIHLTADDSLIILLDAIIHENSHLYFNLSWIVSPLCTPDAPMGYSPLKKRERPLNMLILAFHALGNILLLYINMMKSASLDVNQNELNEGIKYNANLVTKLADEINKYRPYLTQTGLDLCQPLYDRLLQDEFGRKMCHQ